MKRSIVILILVAAFFLSSSAAQGSGFGLGIILGEPTGLSLKNWLGNRTALDFAVAWSFANNDSLHLHADYLVHDFNIFKVKKGKLLLYYGIGGRVKTEKKSKVGVRIPIGISYIFEKAPLDIFFELAPLFDLVPKTDFGITGGIGIRYYFK
jgi:hypothetical protein